MKSQSNYLRPAVIILAFIGFTVLVVFMIILIAGDLRAGAQGGVTVENLIAGQDQLGEVQDVTSSYCGDNVECVEAWSTDLGVFMRFDDQDEADHWAMVFGADGAQWERFVLDSRGLALTDDQRMTAVQILRQYDGT